jgi:hypothetical protein
VSLSPASSGGWHAAITGSGARAGVSFADEEVAAPEGVMPVEDVGKGSGLVTSSSAGMRAMRGCAAVLGKNGGTP